MRSITVIAIVIAMAAFSCTAVKSTQNTLDAVLSMQQRHQHHAGLVIFDPEAGHTVVEHNADKYFTPASNTKVLTLYTAINTLTDSLPGIYYIENADSLIFWGTGDPSLLNPELPASKVLEFLYGIEKKLYFSSANYKDQHFGPGWAWDDYMYTFSAEKSPMPIYGNMVSVKADKGKLSIDQPYFKRYFWLGDTIAGAPSIIRDLNSNDIYYFPSSSARSLSDRVPFQYSDWLFTQALADTLNRTVSLTNLPLPDEHRTLYSIPADSAYKVMMQESDNFIAEQLLLVCSSLSLSYMETEGVINHAKSEYFQGMPDAPVWVDGSGLSRYNLFTPRSMVWLWHELYKKIPADRLMSLISSGGEAGTLKEYYRAEKPYIYGKTGTLSNNHNLSGFLKTKNGKLYIFAFMNNNYPVKSAAIKKDMEQILHDVYLNN